MSGPVSEQAVTAARGWIGTPYRHQASCKGAGADCLGLIRGIWREVLGAEPEAVPSYTRDWAEPGHDELLMRAALRHCRLKQADEPEAAGDLLLFRMREGAVAKHLGLAAETGAAPTFIHAYSGHAVVESPLSLPWRRRIVDRFAFPERT